MSKLPTRRLGKNGPEVSKIGFGCMSVGISNYGPKSDDPSITLKKALELGVTFWDTADIYGSSEELIGEVIKSRREEVFLCTKFGITMQGPNGKPEYVRSQCENSLKKLQTSYIDLYYMHRMDPTTPIEETMKELSSLVKEGKIKYIGLSECSAETLKRAHAVHPISAVQVEYSPWTLDIETNGLLSACRELGVSIVAYSPLGRGFLTGKFKTPEDLDKNDWRRENPRFQGENFKKNIELTKEIERIASKKGCTPAQLCLAWVMYQGEDFIPIPGTGSAKNLESNIESLKVNLTKEDDQEIRKIVNSFKVEGTRYPEQMMSGLNK